ncbi:MAG: hypothetical protein ABI614_17620, partial [Planctomycetota bacterium]
MTQTASRTQAQQEDSLARQQQAFDKAIRALKFDRQRRAIELDKSKQKLEKQTAELKELRDDRKHLVIQSPDDGIIYHDKLTRGRLADSPSTLAEASNDPGGDTNNGTGTNGGATNYDNGGDSPGLPNGNH